MKTLCDYTKDAQSALFDSLRLVIRNLTSLKNKALNIALLVMD